MALPIEGEHMSNLTVVHGDDKYEVLVPFDMYYDGDTEIRSFTSKRQMRVVILCKHCKNFRLEPYVCYSWDEMVEQGWVVKVPKEANDAQNNA
jgi:hypothetical protein